MRRPRRPSPAFLLLLQVLRALRDATRARYGAVSRGMLQQLIDTRGVSIMQVYEAAGSLAAAAAAAPEAAVGGG
jgi:hypothetical protein